MDDAEVRTPKPCWVQLVPSHPSSAREVWAVLCSKSLSSPGVSTQVAVTGGSITLEKLLFGKGKVDQPKRAGESQHI